MSRAAGEAPRRARLIVLPGMDGGASLSARFRELMSEAHEVRGVEYPTHERWGYERLTEHVRSELDASREPTVLIAESFSGPVAIRIAASPPSHLAAVVLVATFAVSPVWPALRPLVATPLFWLTPPAFAVRRVMLDHDAPAARVREVVAAIERPAPSVASYRLREILSVDVRPELDRVALPALAIRASRDRLVSRHRSVSAHRADLPTRDIDSPHLVLCSRPRQAADLVSEFVSALC